MFKAGEDFEAVSVVSAGGDRLPSGVRGPVERWALRWLARRWITASNVVEIFRGYSRQLMAIFPMTLLNQPGTQDNFSSAEAGHMTRIWLHLKLAIVFLSIPAICYYVLDSAVTEMNSVWRNVVTVQLPADQVPTLETFCQYAPTVAQLKLQPLCDPFIRAGNLKLLTVITAFGTLLFAGLIRLAGIASRANRQVLLRLFRPGFVVSNLFVAALLVVQTILISQTIRTSYWASEERASLIFGSLFGLFALCGIFFTLLPLVRKAERARSTVPGRVLTAEACPGLWGYVTGLAERVGSDPPQNLVVGFAPTFFVTEADVQCLDGLLNGRTMYLSLPLCRILTTDELSGVIAHELGHFKGEDTAFSLHFYPIYRGALGSLIGVKESASRINSIFSAIPFFAINLLGLAGSLSLFPSGYMIGYFLECFAGAENAVSRDRELAADSVAASVAGAPAIATALVKLYAFTEEWNGLVGSIRDRLAAEWASEREATPDATSFFANVGELYAYRVRQAATLESLESLDTMTIPHPTDSHPPLSARLAALGLTVESVTPGALDVSPSPASSELIDNCDALEKDLSMVEQTMQGAALQAL